MTSKNAAVRTLVQAAVAFVAGGFLTEAWNLILSNHEIDATSRGLITILLTYIVTLVQNEREHKGATFPVVTGLKQR